MGLIINHPSRMGDTRPYSYHNYEIDRWNTDNKFLILRVFVFTDISKKTVNPNVFELYRLRITESDYDSYMTEQILLTRNINPNVQIHNWLKSIDPEDGNYPRWKFDYKNDGYYSLKSAERQYFTWQNNDIIYNETVRSFQQYNSAQQSWVNIPPP